MLVERILVADDPKVAAYRDVRDGDLLRARGLFMAEGRLVVRRILEDPRYAVHSVVVNDAALEDLSPTFEEHAPHLPVYLCGAAALHAIAGYDLHRGCLALVERPAPATLPDLLREARSLVILEGVTNADNVGGVFRNAAAFGAGGVLLSPTCCDPLYRKAIRTSMGAVLQVPFARADEWPAALGAVRSAGFTIVALTPRKPATPLAEFARESAGARIALVAGTEGAGLTRDVESSADHRVSIPISGTVDSLNLAVAVGIALHSLSQPVATGRD
jgi:tRNA G18 (ribose-2'-O)-methylase SpoU